MRELLKPVYVGGSVVCVLIGAFLVALIVRNGERSHPHRPAGLGQARPAALPPRYVLPTELPTDRSQLVYGINRAQTIIDDPSSTSRELASAGLFEQLATGALGRETLQARRAMLAILGRQAAASMRTNLKAAAALTGLVAPQVALPHWKIVPPPAPNTLLGYFRAAQSRFGIGWEYLAAIELIETRFGRVQGLSSAGAQGPMQFLPSTWAQYGSGNIANQRDAVLGAARFLVASGAQGSMADALYHYNPSRGYVNAVQDYASRMRADGRAYYGYYYWQVLYRWVGGTVILPAGYPEVRPVPVH
jgi:hypothetical protein